MRRSDPLDFFDVGALLSDDERLIRDTVGRFVDREVTPLIADCFATERFPIELVPRLAELGLFGATLRGYGCRRPQPYRLWDHLRRARARRQQHAQLRFRAEQPRHGRHLRVRLRRPTVAMAAPARARQKLGCFALTEAHGGSDPASMRTRARRRGSDWKLDGAKHWITNGALADVAIVWAMTDDGVKAFLVEKGTSGFESHVIKNKLSLRASSTAELTLTDVSVPESARLPDANGLKAALRCLDEARFGIAWGACGAARACIDTVLRYTQSRELFGRPLSHTQLIQTRLANAVRKLASAQLIAWRLARLKEQGASHERTNFSREMEQRPRCARHCA